MTGSRPHERDVDPVTGYETTGHDWNGIRELNTPFPRIVLWALALAFLYSVIAWILLPAWPIGRDFTRGLLGLDQGEMALAGYEKLEEARSDWMAAFADNPVADLAADPGLLARARPTAVRLFADNCAACHGTDGTGGPGFPNLTDRDWLWGGAPETIAETIRVGINSTDPDTRFAQMPAFGRDGMLSREDIVAVAKHVVALGHGQADPDSRGAAVFAENCVACHGEGGKGIPDNGAPTLISGHWIYGGDIQTVMTTLWNGRQGEMPTWQDRLSTAEINILALYVASLSENDGERDR
ncbi:MAG: cytochrome-c oxidase, cbb3-type subunit III [Bauldia sp.]|uniref:cytochrome-c oxidase, cbb3-type subunit III n=1 Tax=Bauldia sp. TaxID=2575872 RepID=UPI001D6AD584|nr:cytochrome-c oxidase, cbb3-type subunit III [Bauldia sp.]MCB1494317.1 cytochrome-c oxidase, cbb3-type subunit III [Bauldia sp.]